MSTLSQGIDKQPSNLASKQVIDIYRPTNATQSLVIHAHCPETRLLHKHYTCLLLPSFYIIAAVWKLPPGHPRKTWFQQVEEDIGLSISA